MKSLAVTVIIIGLLASCNTKKTKSTGSNEKLVQQYFAHFNNHDFTKMANMYSDTAEFKDPTLGQGIVKQTRMQTVEKYSTLNKIFPNLKDEVIKMYPSGDKHIVVEFKSSGTGADNSTFELPICAIFTIENGLITKDFTYFDNFKETAASK
jgi:ketosteroid isomerase-like protein